MLEELQSAFRFNDAVIRNLVIQRDEPETEPSPLVRSRDDRDGRGDRDDRDDRDDQDDRGGDRDDRDTDDEGDANEEIV